MTLQEVPIGVWRVTRVITAEEKAVEKAAKVHKVDLYFCSID